MHDAIALLVLNAPPGVDNSAQHAALAGAGLYEQQELARAHVSLIRLYELSIPRVYAIDQVVDVCCGLCHLLIPQSYISRSAL